MTIEKIVCPVLVTKYSNQARTEVFVRFGDSDNPVAVMCPEYAQSIGECNASTIAEGKRNKCIYHKWANFSV